MSFQDMDLDNIPEVELLSENDVHQVSIKKATLKNSKTGRMMLSILFECPQYPEAENIFENLCSTLPDDTKQTERMMKQNMVGFCNAFYISTDEFPDVSNDPALDTKEGVPLDILIGRTGNVTVAKEEDQNDNLRNVIKTYIAS